MRTRCCSVVIYARVDARADRVRFPVRVPDPWAAGVRCGGRYCHSFYSYNYLTSLTYVSRIIWRKTYVTGSNRTRGCVCVVIQGTCAIYEISAGEITVTFEKVSYVTKAQMYWDTLSGYRRRRNAVWRHMSMCRNKSLVHSHRGFFLFALLTRWGRLVKYDRWGWRIVCRLWIKPVTRC